MIAKTLIVLTLLMAISGQPVTFNVDLNLNDLIRQAKQEAALNPVLVTAPTPIYSQKNIEEEEETLFSKVFTSDEEDGLADEGFLTRNVKSPARNDAISIFDLASTDTTGLGMPSIGTGTATSTGSVQIVINVVATDPEVAITNSI